MAVSTCIKCGGHSFEVALETPSESNYQLLFVRCATCGGVVSVLDGYNIGFMVGRLTEAVKEIARHFKIPVRLD